MTATDLSIDNASGRVWFELTNNHTANITLTEMEITWPLANGNLQQIDILQTIYNISSPPPFLLIGENDWLVGVGQRTIGKNNTEPLYIYFANTPLATTGYTVVLIFDLGCQVTITK